MRNLGFFGVIHLILVVYAGLRILDSRDDTLRKVLWIVLVALFPLFGLIAWYLLGPGSPRHS